MIECAHMALKPHPKLVNRLLAPLLVVGEGEEGGERVGDGERADIVLQDQQHIEALSINIESVFPKRKRAETSLREVRSWPSQFWLAGAFVVLVRRRESDYPSRNQGTVAKIGRGRETKDNPQRT